MRQCICRQWSSSHEFFLHQWQCVKKSLHRGLAEAPAALMRPQMVAGIEISLQLFDGTRNDAGSSRPKRPTPGLSQAGMQEVQRRARVPQRRSGDTQAWRRARGGQDQAACGGDLRSVLTAPARDAPDMARPGLRNGSRLPNRETAKETNIQLK